MFRRTHAAAGSAAAVSAREQYFLTGSAVCSDRGNRRQLQVPGIGEPFASACGLLGALVWAMQDAGANRG